MLGRGSPLPAERGFGRRSALRIPFRPLPGQQARRGGSGEWLAITYRPRGIAVSVLCLAAVKTPIIDGILSLEASAITTDEVAEVPAVAARTAPEPTERRGAGARGAGPPSTTRGRDRNDRAGRRPVQTMSACERTEALTFIPGPDWSVRASQKPPRFWSAARSGQDVAHSSSRPLRSGRCRCSCDAAGESNVWMDLQLERMLRSASWWTQAGRRGRGGGRRPIRRGRAGVLERRERSVALRAAVRNGWDVDAVRDACARPRTRCCGDVHRGGSVG